MTRRTLGATLAALAVAPRATGQDAMGRPPSIVAAGGVAGPWPGWTRPAYEAAVAQGADMLGASIAATKDGLVVVTPDVELSGSTDVAAHAEFADRRTTKFMGEDKRDGWFVDDFTLAELKSLSLAAAAGPQARGKGSGRAGLMTLDDLVGVARAQSVKTARVVGLWLRLLDPGYFERADLALEPKTAEVLRLQGYDAPAAAAFAASPERSSLAALKELTGVRLVFAPAKAPSVADLEALAHIASAVAVDALDLVSADAKTETDLGLAGRITSAGFGVHALCGRAGETWPKPPLKPRDARRLFETLTRLGVQAIVTDDVATAVRGRAQGMRAPAKT